MSDIFREVDEDIRQEKYRRLWDRFGPWVIGVAVLIVVGTGGYRGWLYWEEQQSQSAGDTFFDAVQLSEEGKYEEAAALYGELEGAIGSYPALAQLRRATDLANSGETEAALTVFDAVSRDSAHLEGVRNVAALRAAYLAVDQEDYAAVADRIERLTEASDPYRSAARELLALSAWKNGEIASAQQWITALEEDAETPGDVSRRVSILKDLIRSSNGDVQADSEGTDQ
ncbi:tetratricopeptide repeat protein [Roseibium sediminicola]|uniref:Tetratricopeptide repeat protein n=1 Tax=Roseibium sediminicola TaxID=2933272 RepID=A0ABT0GXQ8_9HYPH|nr:tetratricopeptide repeat protein [Roseibium sp. CAU 1639]MCK7614225.1 tetratricopeptide repeat protein [Roseibium sp. CAU 1639]